MNVEVPKKSQQCKKRNFELIRWSIRDFKNLPISKINGYKNEQICLIIKRANLF